VTETRDNRSRFGPYRAMCRQYRPSTWPGVRALDIAFHDHRLLTYVFTRARRALLPRGRRGARNDINPPWAVSGRKEAKVRMPAPSGRLAIIRKRFTDGQTCGGLRWSEARNYRDDGDDHDPEQGAGPRKDKSQRVVEHAWSELA
jgi:hypothetical protein